MPKILSLLNWLTLALLAVLISSCALTGETTKITSAIKEDNGKIQAVYFCPRDDCEQKLANFILTANQKVHCAFFDLDLEKVKNALTSQYEKGLDVKLVIDTDNYKLIKDLSIPIKQDNRSAFMHNKFCIVDNKISTGSLNPTINGAEKNNNNLIILLSPTLATNYENEFNEFWNKTFGKGDKTTMPIVYLNNTKVENYFCPEDNCGKKVEQTLKTAKNNIKLNV